MTWRTSRIVAVLASALFLCGAAGPIIVQGFSPSASRDLIPATDNAYDLGTASLRWQDLFLSGTLGLRLSSGTSPAGGFHMLSLATSSTPAAFSSDDFIVGRSPASGGSSGAFFARYNDSSNESFIGSLSPGTSWRRLRIGVNDLVIQDGTGNAQFVLSANTGTTLAIRSDWQVAWASTTAATGSADSGIKRAAAGILSVTDGSTGNGQIRVGSSALTAATMTATNVAELRCVVSRYDWTNAMVTALGAVGSGDVSIATLPAKTVVRNAYVVITSPDSSANALTVEVRDATGGGGNQYMVAGDAKAAANTVYGDAGAERGAALTGYSLPSYTGTTTFYARFAKSVTNLSTVTGSTGAVYLETCTIP